MKRHYLLLLLCGSLMACTTNEQLISRYEQACHEGDMALAAETRIKLLDIPAEELTSEQTSRMDSATFLLTLEQLDTLKQELNKRLYE